MAGGGGGGLVVEITNFEDYLVVNGSSAVPAFSFLIFFLFLRSREALAPARLPWTGQIFDKPCWGPCHNGPLCPLGTCREPASVSLHRFEK